MTIHYHGTPITPAAQLARMAGEHFCVSFYRPDNADVCESIGQSVLWDNGAFSHWTRGGEVDERALYEWLEPRLYHPHKAVVLDVIDKPVEVQREALKRWPFPRDLSWPVWHLDKPLDYLAEAGGRMAGCVPWIGWRLRRDRHSDVGTADGGRVQFPTAARAPAMASWAAYAGAGSVLAAGVSRQHERRPEPRARHRMRILQGARVEPTELRPGGAARHDGGYVCGNAELTNGGKNGLASRLFRHAPWCSVRPRWRCRLRR